MLFVLESIGGYRPPPETATFMSLLQWHRTAAGLEGNKIKLSVPEVPRQVRLSQNCGMFCLHFLQQIIDEPEFFECGALLNRLGDWFPSKDVDSKRREVAKLIRNQASVQRGPGGPLEGGSAKELTLTDPETMAEMVNFQISHLLLHRVIIGETMGWRGSSEDG